MKCSFVQRFLYCISATEPVYLTEWEGFLSSPNYPTAYPANVSLTWIKSVSPGNRVKITIFTLQVRSANTLQGWRGFGTYNLCCTFLPFNSPEIIYTDRFCGQVRHLRFFHAFPVNCRKRMNAERRVLACLTMCNLYVCCRLTSSTCTSSRWRAAFNPPPRGGARRICKG